MQCQNALKLGPVVPYEHNFETSSLLIETMPLFPTTSSDSTY